MNSIGSAHAEVILVPEDLFARALPIECFSLSVVINNRRTVLPQACKRKSSGLIQVGSAG